MQQTARAVNAQPARAARTTSDITHNLDELNGDRLLVAMQHAIAILRPNENLRVRWHKKQAIDAAPRVGE